MWHGDLRRRHLGEGSLPNLLVPFICSNTLWTQSLVHNHWKASVQWLMSSGFASRKVWNDLSLWVKSKWRVILSMGLVSLNMDRNMTFPRLSKDRNAWGKPAQNVEHVANRSVSWANKECNSVVHVRGWPRTNRKVLWVMALTVRGVSRVGESLIAVEITVNEASTVFIDLAWWRLYFLQGVQQFRH